MTRSLVRSTVLPNLMAHVQSTSLPTPVRMAAAALVFACEHSVSQHWSQIARTATSSNVEFQSFIASSIQSMAQMDTVADNHHRMKHIASQIQSEVSNLRGADAYQGISQNLYYAEEVGEKSEIEFLARFALLKSYRSNEYLHLFTKGSFNLGSDPLELTPLAVSLTMQSETNDIWKQNDLYATVSFWNEMFITTKLSADSLEKLVKGTEIGRMIYVWLDELDSNSLNRKVEEVSFQKAIQPWEQVREVPTILGFPVSFRMNMPMIISTVGQIAIKGQGSQSRVHADVYLR